MVTTPDSLDYGLEHATSVSEPASAIADERRCTARTVHDTSVRLIGRGGVDPISCRVSDIAEGGIFVHIPLKSADEPCRLSLGGRYEVVVEDGASSSDLACALGEGCYATVVRTAHVPDASTPTVGAGLRFDQPLML